MKAIITNAYGSVDVLSLEDVEKPQVEDNEILVEIKALTKLEDVHLAQALNYLEAFNLDTGLLINFGAKSLEFKRLYNKATKITQDY